MLESIIIYGIIVGLTYALIALGFSLIYGISGIVNLTHGAFFVIGAYLYGILLGHLSGFISPAYSYLTPILAMILSSIITGIAGSIFYRITLHQILGDDVSILIASMLSCLIFQKIIYVTMGAMPAFSYSIPPLASGTVTLINVSVPRGQAIAALISLIGFATLSLFISKTKTGRAMKALSQDLEAAMLMGVSTEKLYMLANALSAGLASLGGILYTSTVTFGVSSYMWLIGLSLAFSSVVVGGLGSIKGSLLGGIILGLAQVSAMKTIPRSGEIQTSIPFIIIILVLIIRPKGIFGKRVEME
jgi:branched-chain amino acid transport system permease protein